MWILAPYETYQILYSKSRFIPWSAFNISKLVYLYTSSYCAQGRSITRRSFVFLFYLDHQFAADCPCYQRHCICRVSEQHRRRNRALSISCILRYSSHLDGNICNNLETILIIVSINFKNSTWHCLGLDFGFHAGGKKKRHKIVWPVIFILVCSPNLRCVYVPDKDWINSGWSKFTSTV